ncbi:uncharacterized [Tachysurus ichikawai]
MTKSHSKVLDRSLTKLSQGYGLVSRLAYSTASVPQRVVFVVMWEAFGLENDTSVGQQRRSPENGIIPQTF